MCRTEGQAYLSDVERGIRNVSLLNTERIALSLGLKMSELFRCAEGLRGRGPLATAVVYKPRGSKPGAYLVGCHLTARGRVRGNRRQSREAVEVYQDLLPDLVRWRTESLSLRAIADRLNTVGQTTRRGKRWNPASEGGRGASPALPLRWR